jgi:FKBP-type peptidyl-prolyl cis-trans isomerase FklB
MFKRVISLVFFVSIFLSHDIYSQNLSLKNQTDSISYSIGLNYGLGLYNNLVGDSIPYNAQAMITGFNDGLLKQQGLISNDQAQQLIMILQEQIMKKREETANIEKQKNLQKSMQFHADMKNKPGVITTPSGLQYQVIKEGTGKMPTENSQVKVHYTGTLIDGKKFDSSYDRNEPAVFPVNGVIKGWTEALMLMKEGSKWRLMIPPDLAYGDKGAGQVIGPNETLIFEVELLEVMDANQMQELKKAE